MLRSCFIVVVTVVSAGSPLVAQGRTFHPIPTAEDELLERAPDEIAPPLPTREQCEESAYTVAAAYGPDDLVEYLHESFPNRAELLDALHRLSLRATSIELEVESVESVRVLSWRIAERDRSGEPETLTSDCVVDLRTRLLFDDPETGERTVTDPLRAEWRIRFTTSEVP